MSDVEKPLPEDADRDVDLEEDLDPEAPTDSTLVNPPRDDADRPVPVADEPDDAFGSDATDAYQEENAGSSLDQPSGDNT